MCSNHHELYEGNAYLTLKDTDRHWIVQAQVQRKHVQTKNLESTYLLFIDKR